MTIKKFNNIAPKIHSSAFIDEMAYISGNVSIGAQTSVWPMVVIRGDVNTITIGSQCNIQDGSVLHVTHGSEFFDAQSLIIGDRVTIGHNATLHACTLGSQILIGMGAIVLDGVIIENNVMLAAGSLVPPRKILNSGYLWMGNPVKKIRPLTHQEKQFLIYSAKSYVDLAKITTNN